MTDRDHPDVIAARLAAIRAKKPDWYDTAPFRFENVLGEDWGARIRTEDGKIFVDFTGCDVEYEVRSAQVTSHHNIALSPIGCWVLGEDEIIFFYAILTLAKERAIVQEALAASKQKEGTP